MTAPPLDLRRNFAWSLFGNSLFSLGQWLLVVVIARLMSPQAVGGFALSLAITAPIFLTVGLNLRVVKATDAMGQWRMVDLLALCRILNAVAVAACVVTGLLLSISGEALAVLAMLSLAKAAEASSQAYYGYFMSRERLDLVSRSLTARTGLGVVGFSLALYTTDTLAVAVTGLAAAWGVGMLLDRRRYLRLRSWSAADVDKDGPVTWANVRRMGRTALPLGLDAGASSLTINVPRYAIQVVLGPASLGLFASLAYLGQAVSMVAGAIGESSVARLAKYSDEGRPREFLRLLLLVTSYGLGIGIVGAVVAAWLGDAFVTLTLGPEYVNTELLVMLMLTAGATAVQRLLGRGLQAAQRFRAYLYVDILTLAVVAGLVVPMTREWGPVGAAGSLLAGFIAGAVAAAGILALHIREAVASVPR